MAALVPATARVQAAVSGCGWSSRGVMACSRQMRLAAQQSTPPSSPQPTVVQRATRPYGLRNQPHARFSTSPVLEKRRRYQPRDNNRMRGVSSLYGSGLREPLSVSGAPLPVPKISPLSKDARQRVAQATMPDIDPEHGLWQFFYDKKVAQTPTEDAAFGRAWTVEELRRKSWDDLHRLWWVCVKERNRVFTAREARDRFKLGFGDYESEDRDEAVRKTMRGIKHVMTERFYVWEDAVELAKSDPEIDLSGRGVPFSPQAYFEDEPAMSEEASAGEKEPAKEPVSTR